MIKTFCDFCSEEIKGNEGGVIRTLEPSLTFSETMQTDQGVQETTRLLCQTCVEKALKSIKK